MTDETSLASDGAQSAAAVVDDLPPAGGRLCLVTGATGYIGGRLVPELLQAGYRVRVLARHPERLQAHPWADDVEVARGDAGDDEQARAALEGVDVAYYLIHAIGTGRDFAATDRSTALVFGSAAREAGVGRLVYLGGLYPRDERLSEHLRSRAEVGEILLHSGVPTAVLRAAVIIGSGSASFEMLRYLTERLPVVVAPRWLRSRTQPIAVRDVLRYLVGCAQLPPEVSRGFDIGGPDVMTYEQMMQGYAEAAGLPRRRVLKTPFLTPRLSSGWVGLVTPVPNALARPLVESLRNTVVCGEHDIARHVPDPDSGLITFARALELALKRVREFDVTTSWSNASTVGAPSDPLPTDPDWAGGSLYVDERQTVVRAAPETLWRVVQGIGGEHGWYSWPLAWRVRGLLDSLQGGPGLTRGRRDPNALWVGDVVDWWRVEAIEPAHLLRLRAEMRVSGLAWLELCVERDDQGRTVYRQRALFHPTGLTGQLYWWSVAPFHPFVFAGMLANIASAAEALEVGHADPANATDAEVRAAADGTT